MILRFFLYGLFGWCAEIVWTALSDNVERAIEGVKIDVTLAGKTYLWMLPIYGGGGLLFEAVHAAIATQPWILRGAIYIVGCFAIEYVAGWLIKQVSGKIPWDYSARRWHVHGLIRLDYVPVWLVFGFLLEIASRGIAAAEPAVRAAAGG